MLTADSFWIAEQENTFPPALIKNFERTTGLRAVVINGRDSKTELHERLHHVTKFDGTAQTPILLLLDSRFPRSVMRETIEWRKQLPWPTQKITKSPMIDFFVASPHGSVDIRRRWDSMLENYPDDYHFCSVEQLRTEIATLARRAKARRLYAEYGMVMSPTSPLQEIKLYIDKLCDTDTNIVITGETGTGKELVARALHVHGKRARRPFVAINCSAIPETLFESELFGYKKGAFSGADHDRPGHIVQADRGTLFLDEIGEMPVSMQVKLLRVLQEREVTPLGSSSPIPVDVRIICATVKNLEAEISKGNFRQDFLYRLSGWPIELPPLRERGQNDLMILIDHFLLENAPHAGSFYKSIDPHALQKLLEYSWPGNIRELDQVIERALISCDIHDRDHIQVEDLHLKVNQQTNQPQGISVSSDQSSAFHDLRQQLNPRNESELTRNHRQQIQFALELSHGKIASAVKLLEQAGYSKGASRGRLKNLLGLDHTKQAVDPELRDWYWQIYRKTNPLSEENEPEEKNNYVL
ncbi:sigma-54 dependent DNA-binding response regulator [Candidatus Vecturithrix granuli]|uniref:Sigma-54 dependent DNA-binding response regulator n=1 Tax=Vecturithrix granuli TaxID=1499967 RepID=A0A081C481_VECG1|nr:sigma-54 dependent DNA-binding response regulator [Candidatus Vecturithrix granuli]